MILQKLLYISLAIDAALFAAKVNIGVDRSDSLDCGYYLWLADISFGVQYLTAQV
jgi:hypothetical protein